LSPATEVEDRERLRAQLLAVRDGIDPVDRLARAGAVAERLAALPAFAQAGAIAFYYSIGSEVPTLGLVTQVVESEGRRAFLPFMLNERLELAEWRPSDPVTEGEYVSFQPRFRRPAALDDVEAIVVPGLAFDRRGHRMGAGRGLYDELLSRLSPDTTRIGLAYAEQVVEELPSAEHDVRMHYVVTEEAVVEGGTES
jgi:5-formyltetrahydrofolate cyclo-ligase